MLIFLDPLGKALKGLEDAAKGKVAQDMICVCGKCACGATATIDSRTHVTITTTSPSTSASAAAGGAAAASSSVGGGGSSTSVTPPTGSGSPPPCPPTGRACDCGCGKLEDSKSKPKSPYERDMTGPEQAVAARRAIEAVAEVWRKEAIIAQLHAIHRLLTESGSGRKREEVHVLGLFQGEVVKIRETPMK